MKSVFQKSMIVTFVLVSALLTGCGGNGGNSEENSGSTAENSGQEQAGGDAETNYPVVEVPDISGMTLDKAENSQYGYSFPAGEWEVINDTPLQVACVETIGSDYVTNISVNLVSDQKAPEDWLEQGKEQIQEEMSGEFGITLDTIEIRQMSGDPVLYTELTTQITDEMIDYMIEEGMYTEEQIEAIGGREALLAIPPTTQVGIYAEKDGYCYVATGTYYEEGQKQMVIDAIAVMLSTVEKK